MSNIEQEINVAFREYLLRGFLSPILNYTTITKLL